MNSTLIEEDLELITETERTNTNKFSSSPKVSNSPKVQNKVSSKLERKKSSFKVAVMLNTQKVKKKASMNNRRRRNGLYQHQDKPPVFPKKLLYKKIKLKNGPEYFARLENHLTTDEVVNKIHDLEAKRIQPVNLTFFEPLKNPKVKAIDVYNKFVYDKVRRIPKNK